MEDKPKRKKNKRTAKRIYDILKNEYGYVGSYESIANIVRKLKEKQKELKKEGYIPLIFNPGEAFQFDWGEVEAYVAGKLMKLNLAVVVLCYSRIFFACVYPCQKQEFMLDAHQRAFKYFGGSCERGIYDNLKTAVKAILKGRHKNVSERFKEFCSHWLFEPSFCTPAKGNEKGRVENKVGFIRRNSFVPTIEADTIEEINAGLLEFSLDKAKTMSHPEKTNKTCFEVYEEEKEYLIPLPKFNYECCRVQPTVVSSLSRIFFENNWYSVPCEFINKSVLVKGFVEEIVITETGKEICRHKRIFEKHKQSLDPYHYLGILAKKPGAIQNGLPFKNWDLPPAFDTYRKLLNEKYKDGDINYAKTLILLREWDLESVVNAVKKSIDLGVLGSNYVLNILRNSTETKYEEEHLSIRIELTKYKAPQRPLYEYDRLLRIEPKEVKKENENQQKKENHGIFERSEIRWIPPCL